MPETLALLRLLRLFQSRRDAFEIAKAAYQLGDAAGYARCAREQTGLGAIARQRRAPARDAAPA